MKTVNIIGAGLISQERLKAVAKLRQRGFAVRVDAVHDPFNPQLADLAKTYGFTPVVNLDELLALPADLLVVACPHDVAVATACRALKDGHRLLVEKPLGRNLAETKQIANAVKHPDQLHVGMNCRFMPGVCALLQDCASTTFGQTISVSMILGHGGKPGDEKTWKLDSNRCGGGVLLDPGIHLLDLVTQITNEPVTVVGVTTWKGFWQTGIEEDVHLLLKTATYTIQLEISVVRWRSHFEISVLGTDGYGVVTGRGRSYGKQIYRRGQRWGWRQAADQSASEQVVLEDGCEDSFADELASCLGFHSNVPAHVATLPEALKVMELYGAIRQHF